MYFNSNKVEEIVFKMTQSSVEDAMLEGASLIKKGYYINGIEVHQSTQSYLTVQEPYIEISFKLGSGRK